MNTLKSAALAVVMLGTLYGVYVALNKPQGHAGSHSHDTPDASAPVVEFGPTEIAPAHAVPPSPAPSLMPGQEASPASASTARSSSSGFYQVDQSGRSISPSPTPPPTSATLDSTAAEESPLRRSTYESSPTSDKTPEVATSALTSSGPSLSTESPAAESPLSVVSPTSGSAALAAYSLRQDLREAEQLVTDGKFKNALAKLSPYYTAADLEADQRAQLVAWLDALAAKVIYSREHLLAPAHQIRKSETLFEIADQYKVPWRLLANVNSHTVSDSMALVPGTELKIIPGPFKADVNLSRSELTVFVGDLYAGHFPLSLGNQPPSVGQFKVLDKKQEKSYYGLDGRVIPTNDPANPFGGWWISLGGEVAIHGSPAVAGTQTLGCISLSPQDAKDVYSILSMGSDVTIRR